MITQHTLHPTHLPRLRRVAALLAAACLLGCFPPDVSTSGYSSAGETHDAADDETGDAASAESDASESGEAEPEPGKIVFVTAATTTGDFGGIAEADEICQDAAEGADLRGTFKAWLSTNGRDTSPSGRFTLSAIPYVRTDGARIADDWNDLTDGDLEVPIDRDENGAAIEGTTFVWTNTGHAGADVNLGQDCSDWAATNVTAIYGDATQTDFRWSHDEYNAESPFKECGQALRLYCLEQ